MKICSVCIHQYFLNFSTTSPAISNALPVTSITDDIHYLNITHNPPDHRKKNGLLLFSAIGGMLVNT